MKMKDAYFLSKMALHQEFSDNNRNFDSSRMKQSSQRNETIENTLREKGKAIVLSLERCVT